MGLYNRIEDDIKLALKGRQAVKVSTLRMVMSAVKNIQIEKNLKEIDDAAVTQVIQKQIKQHRESIEQFNKGSRSDLVKKEEEELKILESYMPEQISEEELFLIVKTALEDAQAMTKADMGKAMKAAMEKVRGRADGKAVSQIVARLLK